MIAKVFIYLLLFTNIAISMDQNTTPLMPSSQENVVPNDIQSISINVGNISQDHNSMTNAIQEGTDQSPFHILSNHDNEDISTSEVNLMPNSVSQTKQRYDWTLFVITDEQNEKLNQNLDYIFNKKNENVQIRPNFNPNFKHDLEFDNFLMIALEHNDNYGQINNSVIVCLYFFNFSASFRRIYS